ncbi:MAG: hypothetical protein D6788_05060, partial [Planctomycetota bacterium]
MFHLLDTLEGGGTEHLLVSLLGLWRSERFRHAVITLREAGGPADRLPSWVACRALETCGPQRCGRRIARIVRAYRNGWAETCAERPESAPAGTRPGVILHARNTCTWADAVAAGMLIRSCRVVLGFHGSTEDKPLSRKHRWLARIAHRMGGCLATVSRRGREQLLREAHLPPEAVIVLPNGVDTV